MFYVTFLPQFVPAGTAPAGFVLLLAAVHAALGLLWFAALVLATRPLGRFLRRPGPTRLLNRVTGTALVGFGVALAVEEVPVSAGLKRPGRNRVQDCVQRGNTGRGGPCRNRPALAGTPTASCLQRLQQGGTVGAAEPGAGVPARAGL